MDGVSTAQRLALLSPAQRADALRGFTPEQVQELLFTWRFWARPNQLEPAGEWSKWLILAGRGYGKTRTGAEWVRAQVCGKTPLEPGRARYVALVGETAADVRSVMVEGPAGILAVHPAEFKPKYMPSKRMLEWPNGAIAYTYNATEPDQLRGPAHDCGWGDELAKWKYAQETWDMLQFGMRMGTNPRQIFTTTPRPISIVRGLIKEAGSDNPTVVVTRGSMNENRANLAASFIRDIEAKYKGTRLGRQEIDAEILDDSPDALWTRAGLDLHRKKFAEIPEMKRIVVSIDPAAKSNEFQEDGAATGIVVTGLGVDGRGYVLEDCTCRASPDSWARLAVAKFREHEADAIVAETNQGGDMVKTIIRSVDSGVPYREVRATRGKWVRAEPIAALYEQGRVSHVGTHAALEDEMVVFGPNGMADGMSPDRLDALVWGLTELFPSLVKKSDPFQAKRKDTANISFGKLKRFANKKPDKRDSGEQGRQEWANTSGKHRAYH